MLARHLPTRQPAILVLLSLSVCIHASNADSHGALAGTVNYQKGTLLVYEEGAEGKKPLAPKEPPLIDVSDKASITRAMGSSVTMQGRVRSTAWSATGKVMLIEFEKAQESGFKGAVLLKSRKAIDAGFDGDAAKAVDGKEIRLHGKLQEYKGNPEILIESPKQIEILPEPDASPKPGPAKPSAGDKK